MVARGVLLAVIFAAGGTISAQPNVVLILADDLGYGDIGANGGETIATPHIDALAGRGVRLTEGYVSHPVCSPSRAGLLTGRYQQRHGWEFNPSGRDRTAGMSTDELTLGDAMRAAGYRTGLVGKWHLGSQPRHHPINRGFDEFFGFVGGGSIFIDPNEPGVESWGGVRSGPNPMSRGLDEEVVVEEYLTDRFTAEAVDFIERHAQTPFFLFLSHKTPHTPLQATAKYLDRYRHIGHDGCAEYVANACSNAPLRGHKRYFHEGGIRVPFIVSWPNRLPAATIFEHPASSLDLMDTFLGAAGQAEVSKDSVNLVPYLDGTVRSAPHDYLFWRADPNWAVRDGRWKLIRYNRSDLHKQDHPGRLESPEGGWPNDSPNGQITFLYDLANDPSETINYAAGRPDVVERLTAAWQRWNADNAPRPILPADRSILAEFHGETVQLLF